MEFKISKSQISENIDSAMKIAGYHKISANKQSSQSSFVKLLSQSGYPRFHIYLKEVKTNYFFNLHIDQKKPVYTGAKAHQADYEGKVVSEEAERILKKISEV